ncbi:unnamed protein product [Lactuca virosa]|uniref:Uncharacterized protein n=1 Tax=Lactuca virosa TaxID=75947 RepID=A0AAU9PX83_9ASTR|nr:unnamed protein product [Lactuca virosa]
MFTSKESSPNTLYATPTRLLIGCRTSISQAWTRTGVMSLAKGLIKEFETGHLEEDDDEDDDDVEDDHGDEDVDVDDDEDDLSIPYFFEDDNGHEVDMGENVDYENTRDGEYARGGEDVVMGDAVDPQVEEVVRVNESKEAVRVNEAEALGKVNEVIGHVYDIGQSNKWKKSERILKLNLAKRVEGQGISVRSLMELD